MSEVRFGVASGGWSGGPSRNKPRSGSPLAIEDRLGAAGQLGYMARAAALARLTDRAVVLGGTARQELRTLGNRFGVMLAGQDLVGAALQAGNQRLAAYALLLTWHHAREIAHPLVSQLAPHVATLLPPEKLESGLDPDEVEALEGALAAAVAKVAKRLEDAGEDPFGPLPSTSSMEEP